MVQTGINEMVKVSVFLSYNSYFKKWECSVVLSKHAIKCLI